MAEDALDTFRISKEDAEKFLANAKEFKHTAKSLKDIQEQAMALEIQRGKLLTDNCRLILSNPMEHPAARLNAAVHLYPNATLRQIASKTGINRSVLKKIISAKIYPTTDMVVKINAFFKEHFNESGVLV